MRQYETFFTKGRRGSPAAIEAVIYEDRVTASADTDKVTEDQLLDALRDYWPDLAWTATACGTLADGYWIADGRIPCPR